MKLAIKIISIIGICLGSLAILGSIADADFAAFVGGTLFLSWGILDLVFLRSVKDV